jgi:NADPH:quinone reductase-like Zn-dependent oxidoreductase
MAGEPTYVMAASVNDFDRAALRGGYPNGTNPLLLGRDLVGRVAAVGTDIDYIDVGMYVAGVSALQASEQRVRSPQVLVRGLPCTPSPNGC